MRQSRQFFILFLGIYNISSRGRCMYVGNGLGIQQEKTRGGGD